MTHQIETMPEMKSRLSGCGVMPQIDAVIGAIKNIKKASGWMDTSNRQAAIYWIAVALAGNEERAEGDINALNDLLTFERESA